MSELSSVRTQAKQFYDAQNYEEAGKLYHQLWDEQGDAFSGGRYAFCLCKMGHARATLTIAHRVAESIAPSVPAVYLALARQLYSNNLRG